jgi:6-phosphogluconolactonase
MGESLSVPNGELRVVDDVAVAFAELVANSVAAAHGSATRSPDDPFRLVLSGGSTARACYEALAAGKAGRPVLPAFDWSLVECLVGDERCVPADDPDANQRMIREALVERVTPSPRFLPMDCDAPVESYEAIVATTPHLDLIHLGLGPDGHTASLFPGSAALEAPPGRLVDRNLDPSGRNPHPRLTLTLEGIGRARLAVFTVSGRAKQEALGRVLRHEDLPATRVRAGRVVWLCDREALGTGTTP